MQENQKERIRLENENDVHKRGATVAVATSHQPETDEGWGEKCSLLVG